ncbi:MAG: DUF1932 domain-containing protein [Chloroflexi bacterium]|nr:DUF1932 domain-containing protein [Chloroflexota bacterium]MDA1239236.1 DUF1932 domain-containing protein [Chloroflexota bacterium]
MNPHPTTTIGLLNPGAMGAAVGASAVAAGAQVLWVSEDRSDATYERAKAAGLQDVAWLNALVNQSRIILSICPPHAAMDVAESVRMLGYERIFVDCNAVSPETARKVGEMVGQVGADFVDGGIIGGPPSADRPGATRLYLSGEEAPRVARYLSGGPLDVIVLDAPVGAASALKMAYAGWTKGTSALLAAIEALAIREGVMDALEQEWSKSQPRLMAQSEGLGGAAAKAWRWVGEMEEIAATFESNGLPGGFHEAAAEVYRRMEQFKDDPNAPGGPELAKHLLRD